MDGSSPSRKRGLARRTWTLLCVLGLLAYLCLPLLHAVHAEGDRGHLSEADHAPVAHQGHHHAHAHPETDGGPLSPDEGHDPETCGVCRVYFFVRAQGVVTPAPGMPGPEVARFTVVELEGQREVVMSASPARPLRGPPGA